MKIPSLDSFQMHGWSPQAQLATSVGHLSWLTRLSSTGEPLSSARMPLRSARSSFEFKMNLDSEFQIYSRPGPR